MKYRTERDFLGEIKVPQQAYWGIHTGRALKNFSLTSYRIDPSLIRALALVKKACAAANSELGYLRPAIAQVLLEACDEAAAGKLDDQFPLDPLQGGAGTSTNMNMNEVVANRAIELLGGERGAYSLVHPLEHVNLHQSTNDVYPTAVKIAALEKMRSLSESVALLQGAFQKKETECAGIAKIGRTELQEAVPMTLGAEFSAFAEALSRDRWRLFKCEERLRVVNLGGTAIGTGLAAPRSYIFLVIEKLREYTGMGLSRGENPPAETANADAFVEVSGILKTHAVNLLKIAGDLRLMALLGEITLPALQAGSSIMPGKVNPVILEAIIQAALKGTANDLLVAEAASRGTFQIVEFMPLLSFALLETVEIFTRSARMFSEHVAGIEASEKKCSEYLERSPMVITAFVPYTGYDRAAGLLKEYDREQGLTFREYLVKNLGEELVEKVLSPSNLVALGYRDHEKDT
jgi:aspartate ammonia-lyase